MHQTLTTPPVASQEAKKRRLRRRRYIVFGSIGLVLLLIIVSVIASKRERPIPVTTETAVRKTILQTVSATGKIQPETEVKISPEVAGEIIDLPVEDGKAVKKGDLLVKIKPDSYKALLEQQEAAISAAKATNHAYVDRKFHGTVYQIANTGTMTGAGTQEEVTNFQVKVRIDDHDVTLKPGLSCTADIETNMVKDVVAVPMQAVTIRTGESNLSPEEIEKKKQKIAARDKGDNSAELSNERQEKATQKEEREKLAKVVFLKKGSKAQLDKVTTGIADDTYMDSKSVMMT